MALITPDGPRFFTLFSCEEPLFFFPHLRAFPVKYLLIFPGLTLLETLSRCIEPNRYTVLYVAVLFYFFYSHERFPGRGVFKSALLNGQT